MEGWGITSITNGWFTGRGGTGSDQSSSRLTSPRWLAGLVGIGAYARSCAGASYIGAIG